MSERTYKLTLTDLSTGDTLECEHTLYVLNQVVEALINYDPGTGNYLGSQINQEFKMKLEAWHICKVLPDTDNQQWQYPQHIIDELSKKV